MSFQGKTVMITGGASGMGLLAGQCFAKEGANVVLVDCNGDVLQEKVEEIRSQGGSAIGVTADVRDYNQVVAARDEAVKEYSSIDILIPCAGGASCRIFQCKGSGFSENPIEAIDWGIDVNLKGAIYFDHAVMQQMRKQNSGVIIHLGSISGEEGGADADYPAAKSALMYGLTKSLALHGASFGVRVCCVSPGPVLTRPSMANMKTLLGRAAEPQEIVDLIMYLASDKASFITGVNYLIDGGRNIMRNKE